MKKLFIFYFIIMAVLCIHGKQIVNAESMDKTMISIASEKDKKIEIATFDDVEKLEKALKAYKRKNPNSSVKQQEDYLRGLIKIESKEISKLNRYGSVYDTYDTYKNSMNAEEKKLLKKHPVQAIKVYQCSKKATEYTISYFGANGYQDDSDAFRHCLWNALMKKEIGEKAAKEWATAHESTSSGLDKEMDLYNNKVGRGISVKGKSTTAIVNEVKNKVKKGKCKKMNSKKNKLIKTTGKGLKK